MNDDSFPEDRNEVQRYSTEFMSRARIAEQNILKELAILDSLARGGDAEAVKMFHSISCAMVDQLNRLHLGYAPSVLEWPILLPQDREERKIVAAAALRLRIGSVKAGGPGGIEILDYNSEKGFAIQNLRRVSFVRAILAPIPPAYDYGAPSTDRPEIESVMSDGKAFSEETGLRNFDEALLKEIQELPDYSPKTREQWIGAMVAVLRKNWHLVPDKFDDNKCREESTIVKSSHDDEDEKGRTFTDKHWQGALLARALRGGLKNVTAVPGFWGQ